MISNYTTWLNEAVSRFGSINGLKREQADVPDYISGGEGVFDSRVPEPLRKELNVFLLIAIANDPSYNESLWTSLFDTYHEAGLTYTYGDLTDHLRERYSSGDWAYKCLNFRGDFSGEEGEDDERPWIKEIKTDPKLQGWKIENEEIDDDVVQIILSKEITDKEKEERSKYLAKWFKKHKGLLNSAQIDSLAKLLSPEDQHQFRGTITGSKYGV